MMKPYRTGALRVPWQNRTLNSQRRGSVLVLSAAMMIMILGFAAFSLDLGYITMVKSQLQNAADAAAIATLRELQDTSLQPDVREANALASAVGFAENNQSEYGDLLKTTDITLGKWDIETETFTATTWDPTAVQLTVRRASQNANKLQLFIAPAVGYDSIDVSATTIAYMALVDSVPMALRGPNFGSIDPKITSVNPGKDGPSKPQNGEYFEKGEEVTLYIYGKGKKSPVHLTLEVDKPGPGATPADVKKILRGDLDPVGLAEGAEYRVFNQGTGSGGFGSALEKRLLESTNSPKRTVYAPVVEELPGSRNSKQQLDGPVRVSGFVSIHLDAIIEVTIPDPENPSQTIKLQTIVGTVLEDQSSESLSNPNGRIRLVQ